MLAIGCDHAATALKEELKAHLRGRGLAVEDFGVSAGETADYPAVAYQLSNAVAKGECRLGVLLCGTGVGMSIAANKVRGIRAACCSEPYSARLSRMHNDSNVLCLGARVVGPELAKMILDAWLAARFEGGRHAARVELIRDMEK
ncbi:MAG: ribose 5-phosphate isomerase B [Oscillospiraceae bacterium]|jgi:ribose 5-phosphate isomerase B|nr:ribose 5-phosphate isomerase B [Oscillospiraceae bacterium]